MSDLEAVLADVSYLMAMEKSKNAGASRKKFALPDISVRRAVMKYLSSHHMFSFSYIVNERIGLNLLREFAQAENQTAVKFYDEIVQYENTFSREDRGKMVRKIFDTYILPSVLMRADTYPTELNDAVQNEIKKKNHPVDLFKGYRTILMTELNSVVWPEFIETYYFSRYCQWKQLELNQTVSLQDFMIHRIIGRGGFGEVYGCSKADTGKMYAMKCLDKKRLKLKHHERSALHERNMLALVSSPFVVCLAYAFHTTDTLFLVLDLCNGGDLSYHLHQRGSFSEEDVRFFASEVSLGIAHLHSLNVVYRDLKPSNILMSGDGHCRLSDLGLAVRYDKNPPTDCVGTPGYMAPEVLVRRQPYTFTPDWFSFGVMLIKLKTSHGPFTRGCSTRKDIEQSILTKPPFIPESASEEFKSLITGLLEKDPEKRLGCCGEGFHEIAFHPFLKDVNWEDAKVCKLKPPFVPPRDEVNAADTFEIGSFNEDDTKAIKLGDGDQRNYNDFYCVISEKWQEEVCSTIFDTVNQEQKKLESRKLAKTRSNNSANYDPGLSTDCLMEGYLLKQSGPFNSWQKKYYHLFPNRLEWSDGHLQLPTGMLLLDHVDYVEETTLKNGQRGLIVKYHSDKGESKEMIFKAESETDFTQWLREIRMAYGRTQSFLCTAPRKVRVNQHDQSETRSLRNAISSSGVILPGLFGAAAIGSVNLPGSSPGSPTEQPPFSPLNLTITPSSSSHKQKP